MLQTSSTLPSPGYSMWNPWNGGWNPWNGGWDPWNGGWNPYFWWMDSILLVDGFHGMGDGFHTIPIRNPGGMSSWNHNSSLIPLSSDLARGFEILVEVHASLNREIEVY